VSLFVNDTGPYLLLADTILVIHFSLVVFVVLGLLAIVVGRLLGWIWIYGRVFRASHLGVIGVVVIQAWLGRLCPLTILENILRVKGGEAGHSGSFVGYWLHRVLFYDAQPWVFAVIYTLFGGLVLFFWLMDRKKVFHG
jgi:hypothetical protein